MAFSAKPKIETLREVEEVRRKTLERIADDPYMGFLTLDQALEECRFTSQPEVLARLLKRESLFISGLAGSGKTTIINRFIELLDAEYDGAFNVAVTASTGIAATLIGGTTIHSWGGLGISTEPFDKKNIEPFMWGRAKNLTTADVLIIDEISMMPAHLFTKLDAALKYFRKSKEPFGGIQMVLIGDFLQLPPVVGRDGSDVDNRFAIETAAWKESSIEYCFLDKAYRATDDRLKRVLLEISAGRVSQTTRELLQTRRTATPHPNIVYTTLFTTNQNVDRFNMEELGKNSNPMIKMSYIPVMGNAKDINDTLKKHGIPEEVHLKVGATVLLTKNTMTASGLIANGSLGVITSFVSGAVVVRFNNGKVHLIPKAVYNNTVREEYFDPIKRKKAAVDTVIATVEQIPLKLGYAITVHKSQGQTFDGVTLDLSKCFQPGLGYVALSRVRSIDDLIITGFSEKAFQVLEKSQIITTYVKKRALLARRQFNEELSSYESLLVSDLYRGMYWDPETAKAKDQPTS